MIPVLDLFSAAAGGWSLGMHRAGYRTIAACEFVPWRRALYSQNNPGVPVYDDVTTLTADRLIRDGVRRPLVVVGSPPCQDISSANTKGKGVEGKRSGLYFEAIRIIGECRPRWFALENSSNLRTRGADAVLAALEALGYTCWTFVVRAGDIGANHERPRSWLIGCDLAQVADTDGVGRHERWRGRWSGLDLSVSEDPRDADDKIDTSLIRIFGGKSTVTDRGIARDLAHPDQAGQADGCMVPGVRQEEITDDGRGAGRGDAGPSIGQMAVRTADCGRVAEWRTDWSLDDLAAHLQLDDGLSAWVAGTRIAVGGPKGTSAASLIVEAFGDAVVPQIPEAIGRAILRTERALAEVYGRGATTRTRDTDNG